MDFRDDTALVPLGAAGEGVFSAELTDRWWIVVGPNGGLLAALLLRAVQAVVAAERDDVTPRTMTVQFFSSPVQGPVEVRAEVERAGRRVVFASAVMTQGGKRICQAKVVLAVRGAVDHDVTDYRMPVVPPPASAPILDHEGHGEARRRWQRRVVFETGGVAGGWLRMVPPVPIDHAVLAAMCDNWPPSIRSHPAPAGLAERLHTTSLEYTVYFRVADPAVAPIDECLVILRSADGTEGYHQEDGEVWSPDGRLLATSRQLAIVFVRDE